MPDEFFQHLGGASVIGRDARSYVGSERRMDCHVRRVVFPGHDFPCPPKTGTVDEKGMKRLASVIGVITSVIHLPSLSVISCNFAKKKENKKQ